MAEKKDSKNIISFPYDFGRARMIVERLGEGSFGLCLGSEYLWQTDEVGFRRTGTKLTLQDVQVAELLTFLGKEAEPTKTEGGGES